MRTIPSLAEEFGLKEKCVWGICTKMKKKGEAGDNGNRFREWASDTWNYILLAPRSGIGT